MNWLKQNWETLAAIGVVATIAYLIVTKRSSGSDDSAATQQLADEEAALQAQQQQSALSSLLGTGASNSSAGGGITYPSITTPSLTASTPTGNNNQPYIILLDGDGGATGTGTGSGDGGLGTGSGGGGGGGGTLPSTASSTKLSLGDVNESNLIPAASGGFKIANNNTVSKVPSRLGATLVQVNRMLPNATATGTVTKKIGAA